MAAEKTFYHIIEEYDPKKDATTIRSVFLTDAQVKQMVEDQLKEHRSFYSTDPDNNIFESRVWTKSYIDAIDGRSVESSVTFRMTRDFYVCLYDFMVNNFGDDWANFFFLRECEQKRDCVCHITFAEKELDGLEKKHFGPDMKKYNIRTFYPDFNPMKPPTLIAVNCFHEKQRNFFMMGGIEALINGMFPQLRLTSIQNDIQKAIGFPKLDFILPYVALNPDDAETVRQCIKSRLSKIEEMAEERIKHALGGLQKKYMDEYNPDGTEKKPHAYKRHRAW
jgi:hypothetical protein